MCGVLNLLVPKPVQLLKIMQDDWCVLQVALVYVKAVLSVWGTSPMVPKPVQLKILPSK